MRQELARKEVFVQEGHDGMISASAIQADTLFRGKKAPDDHHHFLECVSVGIAPVSVIGDGQLLQHTEHGDQAGAQESRVDPDNTTGPRGERRSHHVVGTGYQLVQSFVTPSNAVVQVESFGERCGVWPHELKGPFSRSGICVVEIASQPSSPDGLDDCWVTHYDIRYDAWKFHNRWVVLY
jgi:hypothetical protein